jgi:hypothetical protein
MHALIQNAARMSKDFFPLTFLSLDQWFARHMKRGAAHRAGANREKIRKI